MSVPENLILPPDIEAEFAAADALLDNDYLSGLPPGTDDLELYGPIQPPLNEPKVPKPTVQVGPHMVYKDELAGRTYEVAPQTYDQQLNAGKTALAAAINIEEVYGLEAAADSYLAAKDHFIRAVGQEDVKEPTEPTVLLQLGTCLSKLVNTSYADEPYTAMNSKLQSRKKVWKANADESLTRASEMMLGEEMNSTTLAATAIVAAERLDSIDDDEGAKDVLAKAAELLRHKTDDTEAHELTRIVEKYAERPAHILATPELHEAANAAILNFATSSHEIVAVA